MVIKQKIFKDLCLWVAIKKFWFLLLSPSEWAMSLISHYSRSYPSSPWISCAGTTLCFTYFVLYMHLCILMRYKNILSSQLHRYEEWNYGTQYHSESNVKWKKKKEVRKFKRKKRAVKSQIGSSKISDFVELALQRSKFSILTDNRKVSVRSTCKQWIWERIYQ